MNTYNKENHKQSLEATEREVDFADRFQHLDKEFLR